ncbi:MAG: 50S ribosomal protein L10 [Phycisphaeraceae bacterium]
MSKPVKNLLTQTYKERFGDLDSALLIDIRGVTCNKNNALRHRLANKKVKITVVRNNLAKRALEGTKLANITSLLDGPCAFVYGQQSVVEIARELIEIAKETENLAFKGGLMDGELFQPDQLEMLSKYPTRSEAQAQIVQLFLSPAKKLAGQILGPGRKVASLIKAIEEKAKEKEGVTAAA